MRWAIIDDGVNLEIPAIVQNIEIDRFGNVKDRTPAFAFNHATTCFRIIQQYADTLFDAVSIKILDDDTRRANKDALIAALIWCMEHDIQLIHMSIGTTEPHDGEVIREMIGRLAEYGIVIVAANSNKGVQTYPAYDNRVIGVECDGMLEGGQFVYTPNALNGILFRASARHRLTESGIGVTVPANSYAAPLITAQLLRLAEQESLLSYDRAVEWLRENAVRTDESLFFTIPREQDRAVVIAFLGSDRLKTQLLMTELKFLFVEDGYTCILATYANFSLPEAEVIPSHLQLKHYLHWAVRFFPCEVLFVALTEDDRSGLGEQIDLIVTDELGKIPGEISPDHYTAEVCTRFEGVTRKTSDIYQEMINILSEEETSMEVIDNHMDQTVCPSE